MNNLEQCASAQMWQKYLLAYDVRSLQLTSLIIYLLFRDRDLENVYITSLDRPGRPVVEIEKVCYTYFQTENS